MNKYVGLGKPTKVTRDAGYSKLESISPENRKKAREMMDNPNRVTCNFKLKELYEKIGVIVHPESDKLLSLLIQKSLF